MQLGRESQGWRDACPLDVNRVFSAEYLKSHVTPENMLAFSKRLIIEAANRIEPRS